MIERFDVETNEYKPVELALEDYVRHMRVDTTSREYGEWLLSVNGVASLPVSAPPRYGWLACSSLHCSRFIVSR